MTDIVLTTVANDCLVPLDAQVVKPVQVGYVSGDLTVLSQVLASTPKKWVVKCACGVVREMRHDWLRERRVKSCGCRRSTVTKERNTTHGMCRTKIYEVWCQMRGRCTNPNASHYECYGGRGITVCDRWMNSFEAFYEDMGDMPVGMSIDRRDVNGNYEPSNCRWATKTDQARNTRTTKLTMEKAREIRRSRAGGESFSSLAKRFGVSEGSIGFILANKHWREEENCGAPSADQDLRAPA